jgi:hypothetical protein
MRHRARWFHAHRSRHHVQCQCCCSCCANLTSQDLLIAAQKGHLAITQLALYLNPALIEAKSADGSTALHWAALQGHANVVKILLDRNARIEAKTTRGWTALHYAAPVGHTDIVKILLDRKADMIDVKDEFGKTALYYAKSDEMRALLSGKTGTARQPTAQKTTTSVTISAQSSNSSAPVHVVAPRQTASTGTEALAAQSARTARAASKPAPAIALKAQANQHIGKEVSVDSRASSLETSSHARARTRGKDQLKTTASNPKKEKKE